MAFSRFVLRDESTRVFRRVSIGRRGRCLREFRSLAFNAHVDRVRVRGPVRSGCERTRTRTHIARGAAHDSLSPTGLLFTHVPVLSWSECRRLAEQLIWVWSAADADDIAGHLVSREAASTCSGVAILFHVKRDGELGTAFDAGSWFCALPMPDDTVKSPVFVSTVAG